MRVQQGKSVDPFVSQSINLVMISSDILKSLTKSLNRQSLELTTSVINYMIDVVTGPCKEN